MDQKLSDLLCTLEGKQSEIETLIAQIRHFAHMLPEDYHSLDTLWNEKLVINMNSNEDVRSYASKIKEQCIAIESAKRNPQGAIHFNATLGTLPITVWGPYSSGDSKEEDIEL
jgi:hypothetical protein